MNTLLWRVAGKGAWLPGQDPRDPEQSPAGKAPIYLRITLAGRANLATGVWATEAEWNVDAHELRGKSDAVKLDNAGLKDWVNRANSAYLTQKALNDSPDTPPELKRPLTAQTIKLLLSPKLSSRLELLDLYRAFIAQQEKPELRMAAKTLQGYRARLGKLETYLLYLRRPKLLATEVTLPWVRKYEEWCVNSLKHDPSTARKHVNTLQQVMSHGAHEGHYPASPITDYDFQYCKEPADPDFLPEADVAKLQQAELATRTLNEVVDAWLFCCYSGLSYIEYYRFDPAEHLHTDLQGRRWLRIVRQKKRWYYNEPVSIPLYAFPELLALLERNKYQLRKFSNKYFNETLKQVSAILELSKPLTVGLARHTASHRMRNVHGLPDETVADICGHSVKMMNRHYSRKREESIALAVEKLAPPAKSIEEQYQEALANAERLREQLKQTGIVASKPLISPDALPPMPDHNGVVHRFTGPAPNQEFTLAKQPALKATGTTPTA
ncbi:phage integrase SAM-like domain-containing protein [Hymenobacter busanensis]|nr:phage integrase SAM-like domain-containing protein [Hymenobacter busanensis]QHJ07886.1 hypothetical protein GUY19_11585 [Hymenobacter busanensis]